MRHLCVVVLVSACSAPHAAPVQAAAPQLPAACANNVTIDDSGNILVVGRWRDRDVKVLVDTGANGGSVSGEIAAGLPQTGAGKYAGGAGEFIDTTAHDAGPIQLGGGAIDGRGFLADADAKGHDFAIGLDQLKGHVMVLDLAKKAFCLLRPPHPAADQPLRLAGEATHRMIMVTARIGKRELTDMILDTGAGISAIHEANLPKIEHVQLTETVDAVDATGATMQRALVEVPSLCVGRACAAKHRLLPLPDVSGLVSHHVDGLVGMPFLAEHVLVVDFANQRIGIY